MTNNENHVIVSVQGVTKVYRQGSIDVPALRGIDLTLRQGEFAVLAGPSGSGKTTLLNLIGALDDPTQGRLVVDGKDLSHLGKGQLAHIRLYRIGFVFQAYNLLPVLTAYENAEYVLLLQKVPQQERENRVKELLKLVGLEGMENRRPSELSGGQQQRVAVVRAIASGPAIVLADEPTANLDSKTGTDLIHVMRELNRKQGTSFLFSSHDPKVIENADRVIQLQDGRITSDVSKPLKDTGHE
jgi:putative ABC transport system ATP-binding protein